MILIKDDYHIEELAKQKSQVFVKNKYGATLCGTLVNDSRYFNQWSFYTSDGVKFEISNHLVGMDIFSFKFNGVELMRIAGVYIK